MVSPMSFAASQNAATCLEPFVELSFPIYGTSLPADHGYGAFSALVRLIPEIRKQDDLSLLTVPGLGDKQGKILLTDRSTLRIRVPISKIPLVYPLAGKCIQVGQHQIQVGIPQTYTLRSAETLRARIVTIKGYTEPKAFIAAAQRQLDQLEITGEISIPCDRDGNLYRKTIKVQRFTVVGFTTVVSSLNHEGSIRLQQFGIGGKRHMGCGFFQPVRGELHV